MTDHGRGQRIGPNGWRSALDVRQLRAFLALVEHGNVSRAAEALGLAQSTVSETLAALDRALGTPAVLRRRGAAQVTLTEAGDALLPHARRMLQEIDAAHQSIAAVTRTASARVEVLANESVSAYLLPPVLAALRRRWPNTRFAVSVETCASVRAGVAGGRCDVGLLLEEADGVHASGADTIVLTDPTRLVIFSGADHTLARGPNPAPVPRDALAEFPLFIPDAAGDYFELLRRYFTADGLPGPRLQPAGSIEGVRRGVAADRTALGVLPGYALAEDLRAGRVRAIPTIPPPPAMVLVAMLPGGPATRHPSIDDLLDRLRPAMATTA